MDLFLFFGPCEILKGGWAAEVGIVFVGYIMVNKQLYYCILLSVRFVSASNAVSTGMDYPAGGKDSGRVWV